MPNPSLHAVTGAFGYSGKVIAGRLAVYPFHFDRPDELAQRQDRVAAHGSN